MIRKPRSDSTSMPSSCRWINRSLWVAWGAVIVAVLGTGCANVISPEQQAWHTLCEDAPYLAGMSISPKAQRAMTQLDLWKYSVEDVNEMCEKQR